MQDLSELGKGWPSYGNSMSAGNELSAKAFDQLAAPGSESEQTEHNGLAGNPVSGATPDLDLGAQKSHTSKVSAGPAPVSTQTWKTVK